VHVQLVTVGGFVTKITTVLFLKHRIIYVWYMIMYIHCSYFLDCGVFLTFVEGTDDRS